MKFFGKAEVFYTFELIRLLLFVFGIITISESIDVEYVKMLDITSNLSNVTSKPSPLKITSDIEYFGAFDIHRFNIKIAEICFFGDSTINSTIFIDKH